jgi:cytohesin
LRRQISSGSDGGGGGAGKEGDEDESKEGELMSLSLEQLEAKEAAAVKKKDYRRADKVQHVIAEKKEAEAAAAEAEAAAAAGEEGVDLYGEEVVALREEVAQLKETVAQLREEMDFKVSQLRAELRGARLAPDGCCEVEAEASDSSGQEPEAASDPSMEEQKAVEKAEEAASAKKAGRKAGAPKQKLRFDRKTGKVVVWKPAHHRVDEYGRTDLYLAADRGNVDEVVEQLELGADVDQAENNGETPLYVAVTEDHIAVVKLLIEAKADVDKADNEGKTPLWVGAVQDEAMVKLLIAAKADVNKADKDGQTPLDLAVKIGYEPVVKMLIEAGARVKVLSAYSDALESGGPESNRIVKMLIEAGADLNEKDENGQTPLAIALENDNDDAVEMIRKAGLKE